MQAKIGVLAIVAVVVIAGGVFFMRSDDGAKNAVTDITMPIDQEQVASDAAVPANPKLVSQAIGSPVDCSLYTLSELATLWGVPMTDTDEGTVTSLGDGGKLYSCDYNETDSGMGLSVIFEYREFKTVEAAKMDMSNVRDGAKFGDEVYFIQDEQSGVGDEALFSVSKRGIDSGKNPTEQLYLRKDNLVMLITATNLAGAKADYREKIIASYKLHLE